MIEIEVPWFKKRNDVRGFSTMVNRTKADRYNLNDLLGKKKIIETRRYVCGAEREDINYILYKCSRYDEEREFIFRKIVRRKK